MVLGHRNITYQQVDEKPVTKTAENKAVEIEIIRINITFGIHNKDLKNLENIEFDKHFSNQFN